MDIYIASSWRNQHAVEMLTQMLRDRGHFVRSFIENNHGEGHGAEKPIDFEEWVKTDQADNSFEYDIKGATESDLVVYISPSGTDAWAEVGAAWAAERLILGLYAKGEPAGLMRKMVTAWYGDYQELLAEIDRLPTQRACRICGCTDDDCSQCVEAQGIPCHWAEPDLCSRCACPVKTGG